MTGSGCNVSICRMCVTCVVRRECECSDVLLM